MRRISAALIASALCAAVLGAIGPADAERIALEDAGLGISDILGIRTEKDFDGLRAEYEVSIIAEDRKLEYEIDGSGRIIGREAEMVQPYSHDALMIALSDAGYGLDGISRLETDEEHGLTEIGFTAGGYDYDYEIAENGQIISKEWEKAGRLPPNAAKPAAGLDKAARAAEGFLPADTVITGIREKTDDGIRLYAVQAASDLAVYDIELDAATLEPISSEMKLRRR